MTNADYIRNCTECGMAKEILGIARSICANCTESVCEGVNDCQWFTDRWGAPSVAEWLQEQRKGVEK